MLWTIIVILFVLWILGLLTSIGGGLIHILLVLAVIVLVVRAVAAERVPDVQDRVADEEIPERTPVQRRQRHVLSFYTQCGMKGKT